MTSGQTRLIFLFGFGDYRRRLANSLLGAPIGRASQIAENTVRVDTMKRSGAPALHPVSSAPAAREAATTLASHL
jgi:hypothetical protein